MDGNAVGFLAWFIPLCGLVSAALVAAINMRPTNKTADEAIAAGQYQRLQAWADKMEERCNLSEKRIDALEEEVSTCHRERDEAFADALKWKAIAEGVGQNRQEAATLLATERLAEQKEKKKDGR
jgi:hypothetical protein